MGVLRRARSKLLAGVAATAVGLAVSAAVAAPASGHAWSNHLVYMSGSMTLHDDDTFSADEHATYELSSLGFVEWSRPYAFGPIINCVDDEVRGELVVDLEDTAADGSITARFRGRLYEGTYCGTRDLDGRAVQTVRVPPNRSVHVLFRVRNTDEYFDYMLVDVTIRNSTWLGPS